MGKHSASLSFAVLLVDLAPATRPAGTGSDKQQQHAELQRDALVLCALRTLTALTARCQRFEWTYKFFDSQAEGIGRTPSELREHIAAPKSSGQSSRRRTPDSLATRLDAAAMAAFSDAVARAIASLAGGSLVRSRYAYV